MRFAVHRDAAEEVNQILSKLTKLLEQLPYDSNPLRTVWALLEAAQYYRERAPIEALQLARTALNYLANRPFSRRKELEELCYHISASPHTPLNTVQPTPPLEITKFENKNFIGETKTSAPTLSQTLPDLDSVPQKDERKP